MLAQQADVLGNAEHARHPAIDDDRQVAHPHLDPAPIDRKPGHFEASRLALGGRGEVCAHHVALGVQGQFVERPAKDVFGPHAGDALELLVDLGEPAFEVQRIDHVRVFVEQRPETLLAGGDRLERGIVFDRHRAQRRQAVDHLELDVPGLAHVAVIGGEGGDHAAIGSLDRRRPAGLEPVRLHYRQVVFPERVLVDVRHHDAFAAEGRRAAGAGLGADGQAMDGGVVFGRKAGRGADPHVLAGLVEQQHRAERAGHLAFGQAHQGHQAFTQGAPGGDAGQDAPLAVFQGLRALAFGDVLDAAGQLPGLTLVVAKQLRALVHIADAAAGQQDAVLDVQVALAGDGLRLRLLQHVQVVGMHARSEGLEVAVEFIRAHFEEPVDLIRPRQFIGGNVELPGTHARDLLRALQAGLGLLQGLGLAAGLGHVAGDGEHHAVARRPHRRPLHGHHPAVLAYHAIAEIDGGTAGQDCRTFAKGMGAVVRMRQVKVRAPDQFSRGKTPYRFRGAGHLGETAVGIEHADNVQRVLQHQAVHHQRLFEPPRKFAQRVFGVLLVGGVLDCARGRHRLAGGVAHQGAQFPHLPGLAVGVQDAVFDLQVAGIPCKQPLPGFLETLSVLEVHALEQLGETADGLARAEAEDRIRFLRQAQFAGSQVLFPAAQARHALGALGGCRGLQRRGFGALAVRDVLEVDRQALRVWITARDEPAFERREIDLEFAGDAIADGGPELVFDDRAHGVGEGLPDARANQFPARPLHQLFGARIDEYEAPVAVERVEGIADAFEDRGQFLLGLVERDPGALGFVHLLGQLASPAFGHLGAFAGQARQAQRQRNQAAGDQAGEQQHVRQRRRCRRIGPDAQLERRPGTLHRPDKGFDAGRRNAARIKYLAAVAKLQRIIGRGVGQDTAKQFLVLHHGNQETFGFAVASQRRHQQFADAAVEQAHRRRLTYPAVAPHLLEQLLAHRIEVQRLADHIHALARPRQLAQRRGAGVGPNQGDEGREVLQVDPGVELEQFPAHGLIAGVGHAQRHAPQRVAAVEDAALYHLLDQVRLALQQGVAPRGLVPVDRIPDHHRHADRRHRHHQRQPAGPLRQDPSVFGATRAQANADKQHRHRGHQRHRRERAPATQHRHLHQVTGQHDQRNHRGDETAGPGRRPARGVGLAARRRQRDAEAGHEVGGCGVGRHASRHDALGNDTVLHQPLAGAQHQAGVFLEQAGDAEDDHRRQRQQRQVAPASREQAQGGGDEQRAERGVELHRHVVGATLHDVGHVQPPAGHHQQGQAGQQGGADAQRAERAGLEITRHQPGAQGPVSEHRPQAKRNRARGAAVENRQQRQRGQGHQETTQRARHQSHRRGAATDLGSDTDGRRHCRQPRCRIAQARPGSKRPGQPQHRQAGEAQGPGQQHPAAAVGAKVHAGAGQQRRQQGQGPRPAGRQRRVPHEPFDQTDQQRQERQREHGAFAAGNCGWPGLVPDAITPHA